MANSICVTRNCCFASTFVTRSSLGWTHEASKSSISRVAEQMGAREEFRDRPALIQHQQQRLRSLLREILPDNRFYARKLTESGCVLTAVESLSQLPFTTKAELAADQDAHPPYGRVLTYPLARYSRMHQT